MAKAGGTTSNLQLTKMEGGLTALLKESALDPSGLDLLEGSGENLFLSAHDVPA
jgi:hypothetical protein